MPRPPNPDVLTQEHLDVLNAALARTEENKRLLAKLRAAGAPLEHLEEQASATHEIATGLKKEFFPHAK